MTELHYTGFQEKNSLGQAVDIFGTKIRTKTLQFSSPQTERTGKIDNILNLGQTLEQL
jgi:hypothetical protein